MSNLIPTPRVNKHGNTVIRHMRPDTGSGAGTSPLPAPYSPGIEQRVHSHMVSELQERMELVYDRRALSFTSMTYIDALKDRLELKGRDVVEGYYDFITEDPDNYREQFLMSVLHHYLDDDDAGYMLFLARTLGIHDQGSWDEMRGGTDDYLIYWEMYRGMQEYEGFTLPHNVLYASKEESAQVESLAKVTSAVRDTDRKMIEDRGYSTDGYFVLRDESLVNLATSRPDDADAIVAIIRERKLIDADGIAAIIDSSIPALRDGAL
jgi:hypothetical protein